MTAIAFAPMHNTPGKHDATGAFIPCARRWVEYHHGDVVFVDCRAPMAERREFVLDALHETTATRAAFFCHGLTRSIQLGFDMPSVSKLALALSHAQSVALFACSCGKTENGFAARLSTLTHYAVVDAHTTAGHTTQNPHLKRFVGTYEEWIVEPRSALWPKWRAALRLSHPDELWVRFSSMSVEEIHEELSA